MRIREDSAKGKIQKVILEENANMVSTAIVLRKANVPSFTIPSFLMVIKRWRIRDKQQNFTTLKFLNLNISKKRKGLTIKRDLSFHQRTLLVGNTNLLSQLLK